MKNAGEPTLKKLHQIFWPIFSQYIRIRDADPKTGMVKCISCGHVAHWTKMDAGHFIGKGNSNYLKYDECNVNAQCGRCNLNQGNYTGYKAGMIKKYGDESTRRLEFFKGLPAGFTVMGMKLRITEYTNKIERLRKEKQL